MYRVQVISHTEWHKEREKENDTDISIDRSGKKSIFVRCRRRLFSRFSTNLAMSNVKT